MTPSLSPKAVLGRYALFDEIAAGGMATVHFGRLLGPVGFSRTVAIKRLHPHFARDPEFAAGFVDEARLAARIHHPNVVSIIDVLWTGGELSLVMEYVEGDSLAKLLGFLLDAKELVPVPVANSIAIGALYGLHAAHEAKTELGLPLEIVHRDISPQNILVGTDGVARIVDFGIAQAAMRLQTTAEGQVKGKVAYMAPEQIRQEESSRQTDIYALGVVLWEMLCGERLFRSKNQGHLMSLVLGGEVPAPAKFRPDCPTTLSDLVLRAVSQEPEKRFATAREMADALRQAAPSASQAEVGDWLAQLNPPGLKARHSLLLSIESLNLDEPEVPSQRFAKTPVPRRMSGFPGDELKTKTAIFSSEEEAQTIVEPRVETPSLSRLTSLSRRKRSRFLVVAGLVTLAATAFGLWSFKTPAGRDLPSSKASLDSVAPLVQAVAPAPTTIAVSAAVPAAAPSPPQKISPAPEFPEKTKGDLPAPSEKATTGAPPSCPKFFTDSQGIRRVNRKCWSTK